MDVNLNELVKNSPMFNGGLKLAASQLIARAIDKQSGNRYLKSTPIYFEGAGTEAVIAGASPELLAAGEGLGDEGTPLGTSLTAIDAIGRIPKHVEGAQPFPEQLLVAQTAATAGGVGETTAIAGVNGTLGGGAERRVVATVRVGQGAAITAGSAGSAQIRHSRVANFEPFAYARLS